MPEAMEDLRSIRNFIARDAPLAAVAFIRRLRKAVERLRIHLDSGQLVPELAHRNVREITYGNYRIQYINLGKRIDILTVMHGARLFPEE